MAVLRLLEEESLKDNTGKILAKMPVECATYLLNEKREKIDSLEQRREVHIVVIPDPNLETPHYEIERVKDNDTHRHESNYKKSYEMTTPEQPVDQVERASSNISTPETAAVQSITPPTPRPAASLPPVKPSTGESGFLGKIVNLLIGNGEKPAEPVEETQARPENRPNRGGNRSRRGKPRGGQNRQRSNAAARNKNANKTADAKSKDQGESDKSDTGEARRANQSRPGRSRGGNRGGNRGNRARQQDNKAPQENKPAAESKRQPRKKPEVEGNRQAQSKPDADGNRRQESKAGAEGNRQQQGESRQAAGTEPGKSEARKSRSKGTGKPKAAESSESKGQQQSEKTGEGKKSAAGQINKADNTKPDAPRAEATTEPVQTRKKKDNGPNPGIENAESKPKVESTKPGPAATSPAPTSPTGVGQDS